MIKGSPRHQHQGVTRLAETKEPGRTVVTLSEQSPTATEIPRSPWNGALRAKNARPPRSLNLTRQEETPPRPWQPGLSEAPPGLGHAHAPPQAKVALFARQERAEYRQPLPALTAS